MEANEKKYLYADKSEQNKRANRVLTLGYITFYTFMLGVIWIACLRGIRSLGYSVMLSTIIFITLVVTVIEYKKNSKSGRLKYFSLIGLLIVAFLTGYAFHDYYVRFMAAIPFAVCIIFFDAKYTKISLGSFVGLQVLLNILQIPVNHAYAGEEIVAQLCATISIGMMMLFIYFVSNVNTLYNHDSRHSLMREQDRLQNVMDSVIEVAGEVRKGAENAMDMVGELNSSSEMVNGAMKDISDSTQSTAENIQTQTTMTQNIQDAIGKTLERSENMVEVAKESTKLNENSLEVMNNLKKQSAVIAGTNADVADSMNKLQERTNAVKSIADTIFAISSQTNLLALNASIESARAGEAGRGFAVVADEIRQLAEKTRQETENIATILNELSDDAADAAGAVQKSIDAAKAQDEMIEEASESFESVNKNVNTMISDIAEIDGMLTDLSSANNQIVDNIMQLSATTEEVTASSAQAADLSVQNLNNAETTKALLESVIEVSHELDKYITK